MCAVRAYRIEKLLTSRFGGGVPDTVRQSGHQVVARVLRIFQILAMRVAMQKGTGLDPVLVGRVDFESLGTGIGSRAARIAAVCLPAEMVGQCLVGERKHALRVEVILPIALRSAGLREPIVDLIAAAGAGMTQYAVQDAKAVFVLVEAKVHVIVQRA